MDGIKIPFVPWMVPGSRPWVPALNIARSKMRENLGERKNKKEDQRNLDGVEVP